jgi:hypothetical protein
MERANSLPAPADRGSRLWNLLLLGLCAWQGWMTLTLFGAEQPWQGLVDERPIVSGSHPLHLYHGYLGAQGLRVRGRASCYDPCFQAGYPKTPVFDAGSRPAELFLALAGGEYRPAAYKVGLAAICLLVPLLLALAARAAGLGRAGAFWATATGLLVWWGAPSRLALEAGEVELLLAGLAMLAHVGLLLHYDQWPGPAAWLGLLLTGCLGWLAHPLLFALVVPVLLVYYLSVGARHARLSWHVALAAGELGAVGLNSFWLSDWITYWWIRCPLPHCEELLPHRTLRAFWEAPLWGDGADRGLALFLLGSGLVGVVLLNQARRRAAARLLGLGAATCIVLALLGITWEPLGRVGTAGLLVPGLWLAVMPAVHAWTQGYRGLTRLTGGPARAACACLAVAGLVGFALGADVMTFAERCAGTTPLQIGLGPEREALVDLLVHQTDAEARILWEDRPVPRPASRWTALLPRLTGRAFLGGLDPDGCIEHSRAGFFRQALAGRPIAEWDDEQLRDYCRRYNIGWAALWSRAAVVRFRAWKEGVVEVARLHDGDEGVLFRIQNHVPTFALRGQARLLQADSLHISLAQVVPKDGQVLLSLHYLAGMRVSPSRVQVDHEEDPGDGISFVRLRVAGPVARVTLSWDGW